MNGSREHTAWARTAFAGWERTMNGESGSSLHALRKAGLEEFVRRGYPTTQEEEWRFTEIAPIARTEFQPVLAPSGGEVGASAVRGLLGDGWESARMVFVDGRFAADLSSLHGLPRGVEARSLADLFAAGSDPVAILGRRAVEEGDSFEALHLAFLQDGALLTVAPSVEAANPIHVMFLSTERHIPFLQTPRVIIRSGEGSRASVVVSYHSLGAGTHLTSALTECHVGAGATLEVDVIQNESRRAYHVSTTRMALGADSVFRSNSFALGGAIVRNTLRALFTGERGDCTLNGLTLAAGNELADNHTAIDHALPNCTSSELYKAILDGSARGVFNGKIFVRANAQKTDAKQTNRTLLLSDAAAMNTKPQLEIVADDVKCTHGATIGQLDDEHVFYLRSRGLDLDAARDMLTFAFAGDIINRVQIPPVREALDRMIHARLRAGRLTEHA